MFPRILGELLCEVNHCPLHDSPTLQARGALFLCPQAQRLAKGRQVLCRSGMSKAVSLLHLSLNSLF